MKQADIWQGKVAIVTGGSSGIGRALALALEAQGAKVLVTGRSAAKLEEMVETSGGIEPLRADSLDPSSAELISKTALEKWGRIDLLVNNAGAGQLLAIDDYSYPAINTLSMVNIVAPSLLLKESVSALRKTKGAVVNIGTAVSRNAAPMLAHYSATKAALEHLTRAWAIELAADGIRVNAVAPGPVKTGALTGMMGLPEETAQAVEAQEAAQVPLGRRGRTEDIVPWILWLGSSANDWTSGQVLTVDGAWSLRS